MHDGECMSCRQTSELRPCAASRGRGDILRGGKFVAAAEMEGRHAAVSVSNEPKERLSACRAEIVIAEAALPVLTVIANSCKFLQIVGTSDVVGLHAATG